MPMAWVPGCRRHSRRHLGTVCELLSLVGFVGAAENWGFRGVVVSADTNNAAK